jgi:hypothetical protein
MSALHWRQGRLTTVGVPKQGFRGGARIISIPTGDLVGLCAGRAPGSGMEQGKSGAGDTVCLIGGKAMQDKVLVSAISVFCLVHALRLS